LSERTQTRPTAGARDSALQSLVLSRLEADPKAATEGWDLLVLAALDGPDSLHAALARDAPAPRPRGKRDSDKTAVPGTYLRSITVEGFRGIGPRTVLELAPGPGLTLVVGRNGSGKSSLAEALELLLTGDTFRWSQRTKVWREGWRNLHHRPAAIDAEFLMEGEKAPCAVARRWPDGAGLEEGATTAQVVGKPRGDLRALGWDGPLTTYRPFLSYNELGSMLDEGPSRLYDALASILGLDELVWAQEALAEARRTREKALKEAEGQRATALELLGKHEDGRAKALLGALQQKDWGLDEAEALLTQTAGDAAADREIDLLKRLSSVEAPSAETITALAAELRGAEERLKATAGTLAARSNDLAAVLEQALRFHERHGDGDCPVCGRPAALDGSWHEHQKEQVRRLRDTAREATAAQHAADAARKRVDALTLPSPELLARAGEVALDARECSLALETFRSGMAAVDLEPLAAHLGTAAGPLAAAVAELRERGRAELHRREDTWRPVASLLAAWLVQAKDARKDAAGLAAIKAAESWLKAAAADLRNERFAPIKQKAQAIWNKLRVRSSVALDNIQLAGSGTQRRVDLKVNVDGVEGAALGVMSQGELHALALSLFIPRATLPESPFRFIVIDDPVQSMDPARVDGLARVLESAAKERQVVVFTHDDRLPEAVRRLDVAARVVEVTRRESSAVELRLATGPVERYIGDAIAVARTDGLPPQAGQRVVPGLCRMAVEAACTEAVRRRRLARGEAHAAVEDLLEGLQNTRQFAALALFDDVGRAGDVLARLNKEGREVADVFRQLNEGAHEGLAGASLLDVVRQSEKLAGWLRSRP
jgi:recombinational DNA repair ATPase RecF